MDFVQRLWDLLEDYPKTASFLAGAGCSMGLQVAWSMFV